jgi:hypothetical protein
MCINTGNPATTAECIPSLHSKEEASISFPSVAHLFKFLCMAVNKAGQLLLQLLAALLRSAQLRLQL